MTPFEVYSGAYVTFLYWEGKMTELDGVDFAILMAFASSSLPERQKESVQYQFTGKLRTQAARCVMQELVQPHGKGGAVPGLSGELRG